MDTVTKPERGGNTAPQEVVDIVHMEGNRSMEWFAKMMKSEMLNHAKAHIVGYICAYINTEGGDAWPSLRTIAKGTRCDLRTVTKAIKRLSDLGFITKLPPNSRHKSNTYYMALPSVLAKRKGFQVIAGNQWP